MADHQASGSTSSGGGGSAGGGGGLFQCGDCGRSYTRADHLARHVRSHTQEKPFPCTICLKRFSRADLLKRHFLNHDENNDNKRQRRARSPSAPGRVTQACKACASAKLKCEEEKPCHRCAQKGMNCEYVHVESDRLRKYSKGVKREHEDIESIDCSILPSQPASNHPNLPQAFHDANYVTTRFPGTQAPTPETLAESSSSYLADHGDSHHFAMSHYGMQVENLPPARDFVHGMHIMGRHPAAKDLLNFGMVTNLELNDMDFGLLESYSEVSMASLGMPVDMPQHLTSVATMEHHHSPGGSKHLALGVEAFQRSHFRWTPERQDRGNVEQGLSIPYGTNPHIKMNWRAINGRLDQNARDRILAMVFNSCNSNDRLQAVSSFPSAEMLDSLMNLYFHHQMQSSDPWIHHATFHPTTASPELLAAVVAAGAILTPVPAVRKLGYALQEAVRMSIPLLFEKNNSYTRDLETIQASLLQLEISIWSGNKRKIEIAEAFRQATVTMLRRAGKYRRAQYPSVQPQPCDTGEVLEARWKQWVEQQQYLRLAYHLFIHDTQASMSYLVNPLISYAELSLPLPESRQLFFAPTALDWRNIYLSAPLHPSARIPSFIDSIHDFPGLSLPPELHGMRLDLELTELATLFGLWGQLWDYRQLQSIRRSPERPISPLLQHINKHLLSPRFQSPQCRMLLELLSMTGYVSLEDLQAFAGKEDEEESIRVYPIVQSWIQGSESRLAVWHAGQLLREARTVRAGGLTNFWAVAVYHASITLWAYGVLLKLPQFSSATPESGNGAEDDVIYLDGVDVQAAERFIELNRGYPRICGFGVGGVGGGDVDVRNPKQVMKAACELLRRNNITLEEAPPPPLVENLIQLMQELGEASES